MCLLHFGRRDLECFISQSFLFVGCCVREKHASACSRSPGALFCGGCRTAAAAPRRRRACFDRSTRMTQDDPVLVEAPSNRSKCQSCMEFIALGSHRVGLPYYHGGFTVTATKWHHPNPNPNPSHTLTRWLHRDEVAPPFVLQVALPACRLRPDRQGQGRV